MIWWLTNKSRFTDAPSDQELEARRRSQELAEQKRQQQNAELKRKAAPGNQKETFKQRLLNSLAKDEVGNLRILQKNMYLPAHLNEMKGKTNMIYEWTLGLLTVRQKIIQKLCEKMQRVVKNYHRILTVLNNSDKNNEHLNGPSASEVQFEKRGMSTFEKKQLKEEMKAKEKAKEEARLKRKTPQSNETPEERFTRIEENYAKNRERHMGQGTPFEKKPTFGPTKKEIPSGPFGARIHYKKK